MPDSSHNAIEALRHVGDVELTPRPTATANVIRIEEMAQAVLKNPALATDATQSVKDAAGARTANPGN